MSNLDPRKNAILRAVIVEYVAIAEPVGSELLAQKYEFGVRSATVRNELAEMADLGYLEQPHTSAGRIPSDRGYRYFVDHLILHEQPTPDAKHKLRGAAEDGEALQELLRESTKALSRMTQLLAAATTVKDATVKVRNCVISALGPDRALLVIILHNGHLENRLIECPPGLTLNDIGEANEALAQHAEGRSLRNLTRLKTPTIGRAALDRLLATACSSLRGAARDLTHGKLITEGLEYMVAQPEFKRDAEHLSEVLLALEDANLIQETLAEQPQPVTIGRENRAEVMYPMTIVRQSFFVGDDEAGTLALIGPTRMNYDASIPLLDFTARAISHTLTKLLK